MLLGVLGTAIPLPWRAVALLPLLLAAVESVRALRAMAKAHAPARFVIWTVLGLVLVSFFAFVVVVPFFFYDATKAYQDCMLGANTATAAAQCRTTFLGGLQNLFDAWSSVGR